MKESATTYQEHCRPVTFVVLTFILGLGGLSAGCATDVSQWTREKEVWTGNAAPHPRAISDVEAPYVEHRLTVVMEQAWENRDSPARPRRLNPGRTSNPNAQIFETAYDFYRKYLTTIDGARCEHRPTCSRYAIEALRKHGYLIGCFMAIDRLMRGSRSSVIRELPRRQTGEGEGHFDDSLERNDFFL